MRHQSFVLALLMLFVLFVPGASASTITGVTDHSFTVDGLACNTGYQVTVKHGATTEKFSVTTASCPQPPPPPPPPPAAPDTAVQSVVCATTLTNSCQDDPDAPNGGETVRVTYTITNADGAQYSNDGGASWLALGASPANAWVNVSCDPQTFLVRATRSSDGAFDSTPASAPITVLPADGCAPPPPPPPPPPGSLLYGRDWEDGLIPGSSPYGGFDWGCQSGDANPTCSHSIFAGLERGTISIDSTSAAKGSKSAKFVMPGCSTCSTRASEMLHTRKPDMGTDDYYALAVKFLPGFFVPNDQPASLLQPNYQAMSGGAGGIAAQTVPAGSTAGTTSVYMSVCTGDNSAGPCPYFAGAPRGGGYACRNMPAGECGPYYLVEPGTLQTGVWYEFINHVHWSTENDGMVEAWRRAPGESTFTKLFSHTGFPTILYGLPGWSKLELNRNDQTTTDKFGLYLGGSTTSVGTAADQFCRATSFDAARSCFA